MKLTIIHPCIGRRRGERGYVRTWQMEPLPAATLAGLTPRDVEVKFYDDRMETIPFDEATDLVALSVETYTAKRAYQIASEYRRRGVPVVMGGFHPSLCPDEVARYADAVVTGEAEAVWPLVLDDARHGRLEKFYRSTGRTDLRGLRPDRSIFRGKRYLPIGLVEAGRGCHFKCDFCAVQTVFSQTQTRRPADEILAEESGECERSELDEGTEFLRATLAEGPMASNELYERAKAAGISRSTLKRAKKPAGVEARLPEFQGKWTWFLRQSGPKEPEKPNP